MVVVKPYLESSLEQTADRAEFQVFRKKEFEQDLIRFVADLIKTHPEFEYLRKEPEELCSAVEKDCSEGVKEGVYVFLADQLGCDVNGLPERFEYHIGDLFYHARIKEPVELRLKKDMLVIRYLSWDDSGESLDVLCSGIANIVDEEYRGRLATQPKSSQ